MVKRLYLGYSDGASSNLALGTKIATMEKEKWEKFPIGKVEVGGNVEIEDVSLHRFDDFNNVEWYEMQIIVHFKTIWNNDVKISHSTKLRHRLNFEEVENLKEKGIIKINAESLNRKKGNL